MQKSAVRELHDELVEKVIEDAEKTAEEYGEWIWHQSPFAPPFAIQHLYDGILMLRWYDSFWSAVAPIDSAVYNHRLTHCVTVHENVAQHVEAGDHWLDDIPLNIYKNLGANFMRKGSHDANIGVWNWWIVQSKLDLSNYSDGLYGKVSLVFDMSRGVDSVFLINPSSLESHEVIVPVLDCTIYDEHVLETVRRYEDDPFMGSTQRTGVSWQPKDAPHSLSS